MFKRERGNDGDLRVLTESWHVTVVSFNKEMVVVGLCRARRKKSLLIQVMRKGQNNPAKKIQKNPVKKFRLSLERGQPPLYVRWQSAQIRGLHQSDRKRSARPPDAATNFRAAATAATTQTHARARRVVRSRAEDAGGFDSRRARLRGAADRRRARTRVRRGKEGIGDTPFLLSPAARWLSPRVTNKNCRCQSWTAGGTHPMAPVRRRGARCRRLRKKSPRLYMRHSGAKSVIGLKIFFRPGTQMRRAGQSSGQRKSGPGRRPPADLSNR